MRRNKVFDEMKRLKNVYEGLRYCNISGNANCPTMLTGYLDIGQRFDLSEKDPSKLAPLILKTACNLRTRIDCLISELEVDCERKLD